MSEWIRRYAGGNGGGGGKFGVCLEWINGTKCTGESTEGGRVVN